MRPLLHLARRHLRPVLGAIAALTLVIGGLTAFEAATPRPAEPTPVPLPPITQPLYPTWLTPR